MIESEWSDRSLSLLTQRLARPVRRDPLPPVVPAEVRGRLAERLVPVAGELAVLVHGEGDREEIGEFLGGYSEASKDALLVVLAGMVDTDRTPQELLGWIRWDEHGRTLPDDAVMVMAAPRRYEGTQRPQAQCGTAQGADKHRKRFEEICGPCSEAERVYRAELREKRRQRATTESEAAA